MARDRWLPSLIGSVIVVAAIGFGAYRWRVDISHRESLRSNWARADGQFRLAAFERAESEYENLLPLLQKSSAAEDPRIVLACDMQELTCTLKDLQASFGARNGLALRHLQRLNELRVKFLPGSGDRETSPEPPNAPPNGEVGADGLHIALSFQREDRWNEGLKWVETQGRQIALSWTGQSVPNAETLEILDTMLKVCEESGRDMAELKQHIANGHKRRGYREFEASFLRVARLAEASLGEADVAAARGAWQDLSRRFPEMAEKRAWQEHRKTLQQRLLQHVRDSTAGANNLPPLPGRFDQEGPEILPPDRFAAFLPVQIAQSVGSTGEFVCVRHADRGYALEAHSGAVRWVCRLGYDSRWLPISTTIAGRGFVVLHWETGGDESLTLASALDLTPQWTWHLPPATTLAGPPVVLDSRLFVVLRTGDFWELQLDTGKPRSFLKLPQPAGGPIALSTDQRGAALIDRQMAVYVIDLTQPPHCRDVVLTEPSGNALDAWVTWMLPFLLVCENELTDRCRVTVLREAESGFEEVQREEIPGRLWQSPVTKGPSVLLVTDLGWESVQTLRPHSDPPMFTVFQHSGRTREWPQLPQLLSQADSDFVVAMDSRIMRYAVNALEPRAIRPRETLWEHPFPASDCVPAQPLQATSQSIIASGQSLHEAPAYVRAIDKERGKLQWAARVGNFVVEQIASDDKAIVLFRTATGDMFRQASADPSRLTHLSRATFNETVDFSAHHYVLASVESSPPELCWQSPDGGQRRNIPLTQSAIAPVAIWDGPLEANAVDGSAPAATPGPWVAILDAGRRLQVKNLNPQVISQFGQASRELPSAGWWRPLWVRGKALVLSHPRGDLALFRMAQDRQIIYPQEVRQVRMSAGLAARPIAFENAIWVACRDAQLRVFSAEDLELQRAVGLSGAPSSPPAVTAFPGGDLAVIGLSNGHVAIIAGAGSEVRYDVSISKYAIQYVMVSAESDQVWAVDARGELTELNASGKVLHRRKLSGEVSATPIRYRGHWLMPTTAGELVQVPIPGKDVR